MHDNGSEKTLSMQTIITHRVPIFNSKVCGYEVIMNNDDETYEVILFKIHSVEDTVSEHENLTHRLQMSDYRSKFVASPTSHWLSSYACEA